jgi:hypothetical protein
VIWFWIVLGALAVVTLTLALVVALWAGGLLGPDP